MQTPAIHVQIFGEPLSLDIPQSLGEHLMPGNNSLCVIQPDKIPAIIKTAFLYRNRHAAIKLEESELVDNFMMIMQQAKTKNAPVRCVPYVHPSQN